MSLAVKLKTLRIKRGQSLQQLADAIGASKAHVWELETGKSTNPSIDLLRRIAEHFDVTVASLIGETIDDVPAEIIRMHRDLEKLSDKDIDILNDIIAGMKRRKEQG